MFRGLDHHIVIESQHLVDQRVVLVAVCDDDSVDSLVHGFDDEPEVGHALKSA